MERIRSPANSALPCRSSATSRFNALADLLLGYPSSYTVQTTPFSPHLSYTDMRLLHAGRLESDPQPYGECRAALGILRSAQSSVMTGSPVSILRPASRCSPDKTVTRAAWSILITKTSRPGSDSPGAPADRITLRAGYGIFYTPDVINTYRQLAFQEPFGEVSSLTAPTCRSAEPAAGFHGG